ncbi:hypothetical protein FB45DRAFT_891718 [Roridomyces roridus]|uniref:CCHC-type domain-containing protein n=1 Tax=Roridomyces roridus TaxID=1738132 RepID=A0AAD7FWD9_9AGAR|nr:hypothetical protein FB45DRAFT_891718 [Roridomyces roridus]
MDDERNGRTKGGTKLSDRVAYDDWEFETRAELRRKGVLELTLGTETLPPFGPNSKAVKAWIAKRDVATATIIGRLDPSQFAHIRDFEEDPAAMWVRLKETHQSSGLSGGVVVAWRKFYSLCKSGDVSTMRAHIAAVRSHADRLGRLHQDKPSDAQIIATLLMSLPPTYDTLIISLDAHPQKDDLDFVIGRLLNEELRQEAEHFDETGNPVTAPPTALATRTIRDKSRITCFKCQKLGHFQSECPEPGPIVPYVPRSAQQPATPTAAAAYMDTYIF